MRQACSSHGLLYTIWFTRSGQSDLDMDFTAAEARKACQESQCDGFLGEAEIPAEILLGEGPVNNPQAQNWPELILALQDLPIEKGVVTNFGPFVKWVLENGVWVSRPAPEKSRPLIDAGWHCLTECYTAESPNSTPDRTNFYATVNLGWPKTQPVLGIYGGKTLNDFPTRDNYQNWSVWDAGTAPNLTQ